MSNEDAATAPPQVGPWPAVGSEELSWTPSVPPRTSLGPRLYSDEILDAIDRFVDRAGRRQRVT
ncbi:hypothetical protein M3667_09745 [Microbacterium sp. P26]|uniref:hypothetical protein n=1 Tax=Microbacterium sp. P26 TaxID=2939565 RepID=UPI00203D22B8|nr:hypothetical protein [Microbacterium sp. P26]MCM3502152.1 hypothetical protein [Microbacterium sp. P26]